MSAAADCVLNPAGLIGWWPGDGNANNVFGTNNGTLQGGATASAAGFVGNAFTFDGTNGYVQVPNSPLLQPTNLTIEAWVKFNSLNSSAGTSSSPAGDQYIVFKQNTRSTDFEGFDLSKTRVAGSDYFRFLVASSSGQGAQVLSSSTISTGVWYHVAAVRGSNFLQLYVNGNLQRQTNVTFAQNYGTQPLYFGTSGQPAWDHKLSGNLDEVALYNRALSSNEIAAIFAAGAAGKCKAITIVTQPQSQAVVSGGTANFTVAATGFGSLSYRWQFNGTNLTNATNTNLTITNAQLANAGNYTAIVTNTLGAATSQVAVLTIVVSPSITNAPQSQMVVVGATVNFSVGAGGTAPLSYQWRKGGSILSAQTNASLPLLSVSTNDAGNYDVVVTNIAGSVTSTPPATLTVNVPPFISVPPQSQTVVSGANVNFSVEAVGTTPLNYQWRKNGSGLSGQTNASLALSSVTTNEAGVYEVVVSNVAGSITSSPPAILTVNVPPFITSAPQSQTVVTGTNVNFSVSATGTAPLSYQWRKDGSTLSGQTSSSLTLVSVTTNDAGAYEVVISNVAGSVTSAPPATLTVNVPAFIFSQPQSQTVVVGANVSFSVGASGTAPLSYQWRKAGLVLNSQTNSTLSLSNVSTNDVGSYDVIVSNVAGGVTSTPPATLTVNVPPSVTSAPQSQAVVTGAIANFSVGASGTAPLSYQWRKNGLTLSGQTNTSLTLLSVSTNDAGGYDVVVTNVAGVVTSTPPATLTVNVPPFITSAPQSQTATVGGNANFSVGAGGTVPLSYQWRKAGLVLNSQTNSTLSLSNVSTNDAGSYDVVVTNIAGAVTSTPPATLTVNVPPSITSLPQSQTATVGGNVNFGVGVNGTAPLSYQWRKGGLGLSNQTNNTLSLVNVTTNDAGSYDVIVSNVAGSVTSTPPAALTVNVPPSITSAPQNQTVVVGANANFNMGASGTAPLSYQWRKNGLLINGQTNTSLALLSVSTNDAGNYDVVVTNVAGSVTSTPPATLTVTVPPFITSVPQSQTVTVGSNVNFSVGAGGTAPLSYQWRKGGLALNSRTNSTLSLSSVTTNDAGNYDVIVSNVAGSITSAPPATVTVNLPNVPPFITTPPQSQTVAVGSNVNFVVVAGGTTPLSYNWRKGGATLTGQTNATLFLSNITTNDAGSYDVVVTNVAGSVTSTPSATLTVTLPTNLPPVITSPPQSQAALAGANVSFTLAASGTAPLSYQWRKGSVALPSQTSATLVLSAVTTNSAGNYDVVVSNIVGVVTSTPSATLTVLPLIVFKPVIVTAPQSQVAGVGADVLLAVDAGGTEPLSYQWRKGGSPLGGQTAATLAFSGVTASNDGNYDVVVTNVAGSVTSAVANLTVKLIVDPNLEKAVICALTNQAGPLTVSDLQSLGRLSAQNRGITNLYGLQFATGLTSLDLSQNEITDLTPLQGLLQLTSLELEENQGIVETLAPLAGLINLKCLALGQVYVSDYSPLAALTNLTSLVVRKGSVIDLSFLQPLTKVSTLTLPQNGITNVAALAGLTNLSSLDVRWNLITNRSSVWSGPSNLASLYLGNNPLGRAPALQSLSKLTHLNLEGAQIRNLSPLTGLTNLRYLAVGRNPITNYPVLSGLTGMTSLELNGNAISNLNFISNLWQLTYADLSYCGLTNLSPLTGLTNLSGLVLAGNPQLNFAALSALPGVANLWLQNNAITNADFVIALPRLNHLNLDDNRIASLVPMLGLTNLTRLGLSRNSITDWGALATLTNLTGLRLEGNALSDVSSFSNLAKLTFISLNQNRIAGGVALNALSNLQSCYLGQNRIQNIQFLEPLPALYEVDLSLNLLGAITGSPAGAVIEGLYCREHGVSLCACAASTNSQSSRGANVRSLPQHQSPQIFVPAKWFIPNSTASQLDFTVFYQTSLTDPLPVTGSSSNPALIPNSSLVFTGTNHVRTLTVTPVGGQAGTMMLTLTVLNEAGLSGTGVVTVALSAPISVTNNMLLPGSTLDPIFESALRLESGNNKSELTSVDLLNVTNLNAPGASFTGFTGWPWLTNLTTLSIGGNSISNLSFLANLPQLTTLSLADCATTDYSPVAGLPQLTKLSLTGNTISNLSFIGTLTGLNVLQVHRTRIAELIPLAGLTNLSFVDLQYNRLTNILSLYYLPILASADLRMNLLSTATGSSSGAVIQGLRLRGVGVADQPQRAAPVMPITSTWYVSANRTSQLAFNILENGETSFDVVGVGSTSSNTGLVPNSGVTVGLDAGSTTTGWLLSLTPLLNQVGETLVTLRATNDVGLYSSTSIVVTVSAPLPLNQEFFGTADLTWQAGGDVPWFGQNAISLQGFPAAQSGNISHAQMSTLRADLVGPGALSFWWKVSSETNYDWLVFESPLVTNRISGEVNWQQQTVAIPPRDQTVQWRYLKDANAIEGMDAAWLAQVSFTPAIWLEISSPPSNGQCHIALYAVPGQLYEMEVSTNLVGWVPIVTIESTNRITHLFDLSATNELRFYRVKAAGF